MLPIPKALFAVFLMFLVTYLPRMLPITLVNRPIKSRFVKSFLGYVPYAVLASLTFPDVFTSTGNIISGIIGTLVALLLAFREKSLVIVAVAAIVAVYLCELCLTFM